MFSDFTVCQVAVSPGPWGYRGEYAPPHVHNKAMVDEEDGHTRKPQYGVVQQTLREGGEGGGPGTEAWRKETEQSLGRTDVRKEHGQGHANVVAEGGKPYRVQSWLFVSSTPHLLLRPGLL